MCGLGAGRGGDAGEMCVCVRVVDAQFTSGRVQTVRLS